MGLMKRTFRHEVTYITCIMEDRMDKSPYKDYLFYPLSALVLTFSPLSYYLKPKLERIVRIKVLLKDPFLFPLSKIEK